MSGNVIVLCGIVMFNLGMPSAIARPCNQILAPMTQEAILDRIKPLGSVETEEGVVSAKAPLPQALGPNAGQDRYKSTCAVCHETGLAGAPKFRQSADWKPRMAVGIDGMLKIAIQGKGGMPPRGTCMQCSDEELRAAIEYMIPK